MGSLAASPFPRLEVLKRHFTFERIAVKELSPTADEAKHVALRMRPTEKELQKHIDEVSVLLEIETGLVLRARTVDADGDRIVLTFSNMRANTGLADAELRMDVPAGVRVTRPLEGGGSGAAGQGKGNGK
jgi:outer membrane lipoprotein-sorting protein